MLSTAQMKPHFCNALRFWYTTHQFFQCCQSDLELTILRPLAIRNSVPDRLAGAVIQFLEVSIAEYTKCQNKVRLTADIDFLALRSLDLNQPVLVLPIVALVRWRE